MHASIRIAPSLAVAAALALGAPAAARPQEPRVVELTAHRFEFTPSTITLRKGEPAILRVKSGDVTHGLFLKPLGIDATIQPGRTLDIPVTPREAGRFTAICDHFCGSGPGNMHLSILVEDAPATGASR